jgi:hypothetical protein
MVQHDRCDAARAVKSQVFRRMSRATIQRLHCPPLLSRKRLNAYLARRRNGRNGNVEYGLGLRVSVLGRGVTVMICAWSTVTPKAMIVTP